MEEEQKASCLIPMMKMTKQFLLVVLVVVFLKIQIFQIQIQSGNILHMVFQKTFPFLLLYTILMILIPFMLELVSHILELKPLEMVFGNLLTLAKPGIMCLEVKLMLYTEVDQARWKLQI